MNNTIAIEQTVEDMYSAILTNSKHIEDTQQQVHRLALLVQEMAIIINKLNDKITQLSVPPKDATNGYNAVPTGILY